MKKQRVRFIKYKNQQILLIDFSNCESDEIIAIMEKAKKIIVRQPRGSLLVLKNVKDARYDAVSVEQLKYFLTHNEPYVKKSAVVGIGGLRKIIYNAVIKFSGRRISAFDTIKAAKDWLVDRRLFIRKISALNIEYSIAGAGEIKKSITKDISLKGLSFASDEKIGINTKLSLMVYLPEREFPVQTAGRVARAAESLGFDNKECYTLDIEFEEINYTDYQSLYEYIYEKPQVDV